MFIVAVIAVTATIANIGYSPLCVCLSVCLLTQSNIKVVYENSWDKFDIEHCPIKVKVTVRH